MENNTLFELFISAFILGVIFNVAPGAVLAESLRRGLKGGFSPAFAVQIGSLVGDGLWVVLGLLGAAVLISVPYVQIPLAISGAIFLGYLAFASFRDGMRPMPELEHNQPFEKNKNALLAGVVISISNPLNITYWAALGGTISVLSGETPTPTHFSIFVGGFMLSSFLWCFAASGIIAFTRARLSNGLWRVLNFGCGFGLTFLTLFVIVGLFQ